MFTLSYRRKILAVALCLAFLLSLVSCAKPGEETSILKEDSYDELIDEANQQTSNATSNGHPEETSPIEETVPPTAIEGEGFIMPDSREDPDKKADYSSTFKNYQGNISVIANASCDIPRLDNYSIYAVKQAPFTQEFTDKARSLLMGETPIFEGAFLRLETKVNGILASIKETGSQSLIEVYEKQLDELLPADKRDLSSFSLSQFPSDGLLTKTKDLYAVKPYYEWQNSLYPEGDYLYAISDGSDGIYHSFTVVNSENDGNSLEYTKNRFHFSNNVSVSVLTLSQFEELFGDSNKYTSDASYSTVPENYKGHVASNKKTATVYVPETDKKLEITSEKAVEVADAFLEKLGITDFGCYTNELTTDELFSVNGNIVVYRTAYTLTYYRKLDGIFLTQSSGKKHNEALEASYGEPKKYWRGEKIVFNINDDGIVKFVYDSPLEITETVSSNITVKAFDEIKPLFESVIKTNNSKYPDFYYTYHVDKVRLSYSRISAGASNYETGLIVPMYDFSGISELTYDGLSSSPQLTHSTFLAINAIDCSVIHPQHGYY
ncbi:MAG: hypothetical protein E7615_00110 [Ruminococcaceae bacterium]|nr:hypothetical protein [Oscillospiraceae bacterium]